MNPLVPMYPVENILARQ